MIRWRALHSLGAKLGLAFSGVVAASALLLAFTGYVDARAALEREARARYDSIAVSAAFNSEYGVVTRNATALYQIAQGVMQEKDVNSVLITDSEGQTLAFAGVRKEPGQMVSKPVFLRRLADQGDAEFLFSDVSPGTPTAQDAKSLEKIGSVSIDFNTAFIDQKLARMRRRAAAVSLATVLLGVLMTAFLSRLLISPLKDLARATAQVALGDLNHQVVFRSRDEIGELADAFNVMIENLKEFTVSRDFLDELLDAIPDAILVIGGTGRLMTVNKGALHLSGFDEKEVLGEPLNKVLSLEGSTIRQKSGDTVPVSVSRGELREKDGGPLGIVYVAHDVRPIQKLQERLLRTEKMAAVGQLAAGVAHEINNPLGVILGFAQGLCRRLEHGHPMEVPLQSIERESMRCKDLVQDLLTFSRTTHVEREPMDMNAAVEGALSLIQAQARMDRANVRQVLASGLPKIFGSKSQVQQVIINLAKNALDAMPNGGTVTVATELEESESRSWVRLRVTDEGTGIPPEVLPRIFDPFFTTKPVGKGTGLGLALVYEIVKKHSGLVDVKSRPGFTEFVIKLPARTGRESAGASAARAEEES